MAKTRTALDNEVRALVTENLVEKFVDLEPIKVGNTTIAVAVKDEEGNEVWAEISVKIPKGERLSDGKGYAGYDVIGLADEYESSLVEKAEKKRVADEKKAKDIAKKESKKANA